MEAPNQIKFHSFTDVVKQPPVTSASNGFKTLFSEANNRLQSDQKYFPPSPKNGVSWLEVTSQSPFRDIQQKMGQLRQPGLLKLTRFNANDIGFKPIMTDATSNKQIRHLIIRHSNLHYHQVQLVSRVLQLNDGIAWLVLDHNDIDDESLKEMFRNIHPDNNIQHLVLSNNQITDEGGIDLMNALPKLKKIKTLWLDNNQLSDKPIGYLKSYLSQSSLEILSIKNNYLSSSAKESLEEICDQIGCRLYT